MKKFGIVAGILLIAAMLFALGVYTGLEQAKATITKGHSELHPGRPDTAYKAGKESISYTSHVSNGSAAFTGRPSPSGVCGAGVVANTPDNPLTWQKDSVIVKDSSYTLRIFLQHRDSALVQWFLDLKSKEISRTDTLYIIRVDTLIQTNFVEKPTLFFERAEVMYPSAVILSVITVLLLK
jgi:hypothetical protein